jgi:predicted Zn-dependent protease
VTRQAGVDSAAARVWQKLRRRRVAALLTTILLIVAAGFAITFMPGGGPEPSPQPLAQERPASDPNGTPMAGAGSAAQEVDLRFKQAVIMLHAKQYEHAATALHRVLALAPTMPEAHVNMGYAMIGLKRYGVARDFFRSAIALRASQANAYYGLAEALGELGDRAGAIAAMQGYLRFAPANDPFVAKANAAIAAWRRGNKGSDAVRTAEPNLTVPRKNP